MSISFKLRAHARSQRSEYTKFPPRRHAMSWRRPNAMPWVADIIALTDDKMATV